MKTLFWWDWLITWSNNYRDKDDFKEKEKGASHEGQSTKFKSKTVKQEPDVKDECIIDDKHGQIFQNSEMKGGA